ncbi:MAG TPA: universal stress protein [Acidimicrobiales bacterium]|nr:universal stress protein [Acidimicrobiales bacterium]
MVETSTGKDSPAAARGRAYRRILVGFDGSKEAQEALRAALALGEEVEGNVRALLVVRPPAHVETPEELATAAAAERDNLSQGLSQALQPGQEDKLDIRVVFADDPAEALAGHAERHGFDLVVVGMHGREHTVHRGIGHSLEALLQRHPCPVLVV